jgi:hypothetical protein
MIVALDRDTAPVEKDCARPPAAAVAWPGLAELGGDRSFGSGATVWRLFLDDPNYV